MDILTTKSLESNRQMKINFDGGDLSSDAIMATRILMSLHTCHKIHIKKLYYPGNL